MCSFVSRHPSSETTSFNVDINLLDTTELPTKDKYFLATKNRRRLRTDFFISIVSAEKSNPVRPIFHLLIKTLSVIPHQQTPRGKAVVGGGLE
ncbi:hypothetical protein AVEN_214311-1 [Araneus ventricosus]|uniref:Uncharacterized protein n=1 Tax=Araneus ventricosus TaxID=182803 RepID=A0A4Y2UF01_ARAVE|nr:hypothetical protein AVEN_214311-1 [Araneus ventricosus]